MTDQKPNRLSRKVGQIGLAIVAALAVVIGLASPAYANFPHFKTVSVSLADTSLASVRTAASSASSSAQLPDLLFSWTEVGVGSPDVVYSLSTVVTATFGCVNGGGSTRRPRTRPRSPSRRRPPSSWLQTRTERSPGAPYSTPVGCPSGGFSCPSGQTLVALSATFTHNMITDTTNGVTATDGDISVILGP